MPADINPQKETTIFVDGRVEKISARFSEHYEEVVKERDKHEREAKAARSVARALAVILVLGFSAWLIHHRPFLVRFITIRLLMIEAPLVIFVPIALCYRRKDWPGGFRAWWDSIGLPMLGMCALGYSLAAELFERF